MKMRKKLAALLAAAMIASVMPMTAFAASTNHITKDVVQVGNNGTLTGTEAPMIKIKLKDTVVNGDVFYLELENAKWNSSITTDGAAGYTFLTSANERLLGVKAGRNLLAGEEIAVDLDTKDIDGEATVAVNPWGSSVSAGKYVFATSTDKKASVTVGDASTFYKGSNLALAKITIQESVAGAFKSTNVGDIIEITLDSEDFVFATSATATASKVITQTQVDAGFTFKRDATDKQKFIIEIKNNNFTHSQRGSFDLMLLVNSDTKNPTVGDLNVDISGVLVEGASYKVAKVAEYGVEFKSEKEYEFLAGRTEEVVFHLNETVTDSMVFGRETEFLLPEGVYFNAVPTLEKGNKNGNIEPVKKDDKIIGFRVSLTTGENKFKAKLDITSNFTGDVVLTAEGRSIGEKLEIVLAEVKPAVKVTIEPMTVKVGLKEQVGGKVIIEELEKGALNQGKEIYIELETENGVKVTDADVEVTSGDLKKGDVTVSKTTEGAITILIKRKSREASTIELTNIKVKLDRTVPEGSYDIKVGGAAVSTLADPNGIYKNDNIVAKDFLFVGERYTRPVTVFTIGSGVYTLNGETMTMDAAAYIKDGRTMVPVRYLAYALGIDADSIKFNSGIVTIFAEDGKVIQLKNNDKNLVINGMSIPMVAAAEIVEGRTYVPVTEIGGVFGVTGTWDSEAQTATFK